MIKQKCVFCHGTGKIKWTHPNDFNRKPRVFSCEDCQGTGSQWVEPKNTKTESERMGDAMEFIFTSMDDNDEDNRLTNMGYIDDHHIVFGLDDEMFTLSIKKMSKEEMCKEGYE